MMHTDSCLKKIKNNEEIKVSIIYFLSHSVYVEKLIKIFWPFDCTTKSQVGLDRFTY